MPKGTLEKSAKNLKLVSDALTTPIPVFNVASTGPTLSPAGGAAGTGTTVSVGLITTTLGTAVYPTIGGVIGATGNG